MIKNIHNIWRLTVAIIATSILGAILTLTAFDITGLVLYDSSYFPMAMILGAFVGPIASDLIFDSQWHLITPMLIIGLPTGAFAATLFHFIRGPHRPPQTDTAP